MARSSGRTTADAMGPSMVREEKFGACISLDLVLVSSEVDVLRALC